MGVDVGEGIWVTGGGWMSMISEASPRDYWDGLPDTTHVINMKLPLDLDKQNKISGQDPLPTKS